MKNKRKEIDKRKVLLAGFDIEESEKEDPNEFYITNFIGPKDSLYEGGNGNSILNFQIITHISLQVLVLSIKYIIQI